MTQPASDLRRGFRDYLREGHFLADSPELAPLTLALYRRLGEGEPAARAMLADDLNVSIGKVDAMLETLPASTIEYDGSGAIIAFGGLSLAPTNHIFRTEELVLHTWCVFDALFLPQLLAKPATCVTRCPATERQIEISLAPTAVVFAEPAASVMSIVAPDRMACRANLRGAFCNHVNFFSNEAAFRDWANGRQGVAHVSLEDAHNLATQRNRYRYGDCLNAA